MNEDEYKLEKEAFVTGHTGTTIAEMVMINTVFPLSCWLGHVIATYLETALGVNVSSNIALNFACDLLFVALPLLLLSTFPQYVSMLLALEAVIIAALHLTIKRAKNINELREKQLQVLNSSRKPFITMYRGGMMLLTCIAILAVDFRIFPRRFAKTETYGVSLMDAGVGAFMISMGLVSRQARPGKPTRKSTPVFTRVLGSVSPMLVLGAIRFTVSRMVNYQHHVSEYGVHWNFFFTLAAVALLVAILNPPPYTNALLGVACVFAYQYALNAGLSDFILNDTRRDNFLSANKEGLCSSLGFCALYLISIDIGRFLSQPRKSLRDWALTCAWLGGMCVAFLIVASTLDAAVEPISRRMANASFVFWCLAINLFVLNGLLAVNVACAYYTPPGSAKGARSSDEKTRSVESTTLRAINRNQLAVFLVANLLTGAVNLSIRTLYVSTAPSFGILFVYTSVFCGIAFTWQQFGISLKFW